MQREITCTRKRKTQIINLRRCTENAFKTYKYLKRKYNAGDEVKCVNQLKGENNKIKHNASYCEVNQRSMHLRVAYNRWLCFHNANFVNCVYVHLHNTQTSVCLTVKIETPSFCF